MIPILARTRRGMAAARRGLGAPVVLVPTMGALHDGHRALLRRAHEISMPNGSVVVSVFVNPLQFGAGEDLGRYPRDLDDDLATCAEEQVTVVFAPSAAQMYPREQLITVDPGPMGQVLEGASRPGFFTGVLTVVLKLFQLVQPQVAVFGEKDAQQLALVRRMAGDLDLGVEIATVPTVRDPDGLAVSSRNSYLSAAERRTALALPRALRAGREARGGRPGGSAEGGGRGPGRGGHGGAAAGHRLPVTGRPGHLHPGDAGTPATAGYAGEALLLAAARVGSTRLIDNVQLTLGGAGRPCC